jgi:hypothetical protein
VGAESQSIVRRRPTTPAGFLATHGVGEKKLADFGDTFMAHPEACLPGPDLTE